MPVQRHPCAGGRADTYESELTEADLPGPASQYEQGQSDHEEHDQQSGQIGLRLAQHPRQGDGNGCDDGEDGPPRPDDFDPVL